MPPSRRPKITVAGSKRAPLPAFIEPCHPVVGALPSEKEEDRWAPEVKLDGYRVQAHIAPNKITLYTRRGYDWTQRFATIAHELETLPARTAVIDGEIIVPDENGAPNFHALHADLAKGRTDRLIYYAFDLLYLDGFDLRSATLRDRRQALRALIGAGSARVRFSENLHTKGSALFELACRMNLEGIVIKRWDSPYRSGEQDSWRKVKCKKSDSFPIIAFVEKLGARPRRIASLYLGRYENGELLYAGKAQTGFANEDLYEVRERLDPYVTNRCPLGVPIKKPKATWVAPVVQAEVEYSTFTSAGLLREPVFKGLREDLVPQSALAPRRTARKTASPRESGVARENILQLLPDAVPPPPHELIDYWQRVHEQALPYLARRPLKLVRHVRGTTFYHKGPLPRAPPGVRQLKITKRSGGEGTRVWIEDLDGFIGLTQMGVVELHPWNATVDDIEHADQMVSDLDPGHGIASSLVVDTAFTLRELLEQAGFESWPKLTGGKGIHLMVPLRERMTHDAAHRRSRLIAEQLARTDPERFTVSATLSWRPRRLFIDYLRNGRGTTAVGTYSPRARPGHPIAAPVTWKDIEAGIRPDAFSMSHLPSTKAKPRARRTFPVHARQS
jgi:bifunctional non-homologous end joining protein LigD